MDIIKKWFLRIDIEREFDTPIIELYMQDVKTNLFITTITNNGARISLKDYNIVTLNVLKADNTRLMVSGKVTEDGNVIFEMDSQATSVKGICSATIRIYEGDSSVTSKPFYFSVIDDPYRGTDNSIISQNSYTALQNILSQTAKALEEAVKVNDYFKVNLPTVKELISYEPILRDIVKNKDEAKELIRESKNLQVKIDASMADLKRLEGLIPEVNRLVDKGNETIKVLTNATESVSETIARADLKKAELEDILSRFKDIDERAQKIKLISDEVNSLLPKLGEAKNIKGGLDSSIASAKANKASLDTSLESAGDINRDLGNKISQSKTLSNNLKADIENAKTTNFTLNSDREAASLMLINLKNTKNDADTINSQLNSSQIKANSTKDELDKLVTDANKTTNEAKSINTALKETNSKAEANKTSLESANTKAINLVSDLSSKTSLAEGTSKKLKTNTDLANKASENLETNRGLADSSLSRLKEEIGKSENLEASLREIIASGDLSKYVTDPKLEEILKSYATKEDLSGIDVTGQLVDYAKKTQIPTKLSQLTNDKTFKTEAEIEALIDNSKFELPQGKENQVLTKTTNGVEFKNLSRSATFVIANYDSSKNSKAGADYVIQESECVAEVINSFIAKLPEYGGKIQLTEGNFNIKKNLNIAINKNNTIIEGYGDSTNIINKLTKDEMDTAIVSIFNEIKNCRLSDLNITHEAGNAIFIKGEKNYIKNIKIINNGEYPSLIIGDNNSGNVLENCNIKSVSHCYWIQKNSEKNSLSDCTGTSTDKFAFVVEGPNNSMSNCTGSSVDYIPFAIGGPNNSLSDCIATSTNSIAFYIKNSYVSLTGCRGENSVDEDARTKYPCFRIEGSNNSISNCIGTSVGSVTFSVEGSNNLVSNCSGTSTSQSAFYVYNSNNLVSNCIGTSTSQPAFYVEGSNSSLSNCSGTSKTQTALYIDGPGNSLIGCMGKTESTSKKGIFASVNSKSCIILGNHYYGNGIRNDGSDNLVVSNVRLVG